MQVDQAKLFTPAFDRGWQDNLFMIPVVILQIFLAFHSHPGVV